MGADCLLLEQAANPAASASTARVSRSPETGVAIAARRERFDNMIFFFKQPGADQRVPSTKGTNRTASSAVIW